MSTVVYPRSNAFVSDPYVLASLIDTAKGWTDTACVLSSGNVSVTNAAQGGSIDAGVQTVIDNYTFIGRWGLGGNISLMALNGVAPLTWTNMPAALTEVPGSRSKLPLYCATIARLTAHIITPGLAGAVLIAQVSPDQNTWTNGPQVVLTTAGLKISTVAIPNQFQIDCYFRLVGQGGNGVADPVFGLVTLQIA